MEETAACSSAGPGGWVASTVTDRMHCTDVHTAVSSWLYFFPFE